MRDIDIDLFEDHDKPNDHPDTGKNIPPTLFTPGRAMRGLTWEPAHEQETTLGRGKTQNAGSPNFMLTVCTRSYLSILAEPLVKPIRITLDIKASNCTSKAEWKLRTFGKLKSTIGV